MIYFLTVPSEADWEVLLGKERYRVMRQKGREQAFIGTYTYHIEEGIYCCYGCEQPLFDSQAKYFHRGSGWPCFKEPIQARSVYYLRDTGSLVQRYEVLCRECHSHLGHVFHDGPEPKRNRYSINSLSLRFVPEKRE